MKVLLIFYSFPPFNVIGAVRAVQFAAFLESKGHDVRVVAGDRLPYPIGLNPPPLKARIFPARFRNVEAPIDLARSFFNRGRSSAGSYHSGVQKKWMVKLVNLYRAFVSAPDGQVGWYPAAIRAADRALQDWTPDVIVSSALPFTAHLVASRLARRTGRPWVAEFRDLFSGNPYSDLPYWRRGIDRRVEKAVLAPASAIVALTPHMADELERIHHKPTHVVMNGFDQAEGISGISPPNQVGRSLRILYTGIIYPGRRDPSPLFEAIRLMGERGQRITVAFYGQDLRGVRESAANAGIASQITIHDPVSHDESLRLQRQADVLLLLLWDDPRERGTITGKLFEYVGAKRPILAIGCSDGIASSLVRDRGLGATASDPASIARALDLWVEEIDASGTVPGSSEAARAGLSRSEQFASYEELLLSLVPNS